MKYSLLLSILLVLALEIGTKTSPLVTVYKAIPILIQHPTEYQASNWLPWFPIDHDVNAVLLWRYKRVMGLRELDSPVIWLDFHDTCRIDRDRYYEYVSNRLYEEN